LDLKVTATPIVLEGERFVVLALEDISQAKRLELLQRVFFHDVANTAGCIMGYAQMLAESGEPDEMIGQRLLRMCAQLGEEVSAHRDLWAADLGPFCVQPFTGRLLEELQELLATRSRQQTDPVGADLGRAIRTIGLLARALRNITNSLGDSRDKRFLDLDRGRSRAKCR
jgi:hypothetical protein